METMARARRLLQVHCLVVLVCEGITLVALYRQTGLDWALKRQQLEVIFAHPVVSWTYCLCEFSCFAFPVAVGYLALDRMPPWRWFLGVYADIALSCVEFGALLLMYPGRE